MVYNSTNINKTNNHLLPQHTEHKTVICDAIFTTENKSYHPPEKMLIDDTIYEMSCKLSNFVYNYKLYNNEVTHVIPQILHPLKNL